MKVGPKNQNKKEKKRRKWKHVSSFWTLNLLLQTMKDSSLFHMYVHLNNF